MHKYMHVCIYITMCMSSYGFLYKSLQKQGQIKLYKCICVYLLYMYIYWNVYADTYIHV